MLQRALSMLHSISGKIFWFSSAYFPSSHTVRILVEKGLLRFYQWEITLNPGLSDGYSKIASLLANRGELAQAKDYFSRALQTNHPDAAKIHYFMGKQQARQGDLPGATRSFENFVRIAAESMDIPAEQALLWSRLEQDPEFDPRGFDGYVYLGNKCIGNGLTAPAIEFLRHSITIEPLVVRAHIALAEILYSSNRREESLKVVRSGHYFQLRQSHPHLRIAPRGGKRIAKPHFMILGKRKCGTTSLYSYLTQHPCVAPALKKELRFFDAHFDRGLHWYLAQFPPIGNRPELITGEASVEYIDSAPVAERIQRDFPHTRFIILLRDPVERAISHFLMNVRLGLETGEMEKTLLAGVYPGFDSAQPNIYVDVSIYVKMLKVWMAAFPREQFLILRSEQLFASPGQVTLQAFEFLGHAPFDRINFRVENKGRPAAVDSALRLALRDYFRPHNKELEDFLGMRFGWNY